MKLPTTENHKPSRALHIGERAVFCGLRNITGDSSVPAQELTIIDVIQNSQVFGSHTGYLVVIGDKPMWVDSVLFWPLDQLAMIEKMVEYARVQ